MNDIDEKSPKNPIFEPGRVVARRNLSPRSSVTIKNTEDSRYEVFESYVSLDSHYEATYVDISCLTSHGTYDTFIEAKKKLEEVKEARVTSRLLLDSEGGRVIVLDVPYTAAREVLVRIVPAEKKG